MDKYDATNSYIDYVTGKQMEDKIVAQAERIKQLCQLVYICKQVLKDVDQLLVQSNASPLLKLHLYDGRPPVQNAIALCEKALKENEK